MLAYTAGIDAVRPLTQADEERIHADVRGADAVVVYGPEADERVLSDPEICTPIGDALKLYLDRADGRRYSAFVVADLPLPVEPVDERGWWSWGAILRVSPDCGEQPGVYLVAPWGDRRELLMDTAPELTPAIRPRTLEDLR